MTLHSSSNGIDFKNVLSFDFPFFCDSQNQILWDPYNKKYRFYLRSWSNTIVPNRIYNHNNSQRTISYIESENFSISYDSEKLIREHNVDYPALRKELPVIMLNDSVEDYDYYLPSVHQYAKNLFIAYPCCYHHYPDTKKNGHKDNDGYSTIGFWISENGREFRRITDNYLSTGDSWVEFCIGHIETKYCYIHYYVSSKDTHAGPFTKNKIIARIHYKSRKIKRLYQGI